MKGMIRNLTIIMIYICGVLIFAWPDLNHLKLEVENKTVLEEFQKDSGLMRQGTDEWKTMEDSAATPPSKEHGETDTSAVSDWNGQELYQYLENYNQELFETGQKNLNDPWSYRQNSFDLGQYGVETDVIAVLKIPAMDVELPVYLGANESNMAKGAAHLTETSMPIGGENTNCVIAAHRGWKGIPMFREIERLEIGDTLTLTNYWETLSYEVAEIKIIKPDDSSEIFIQPGKDMVTILTCHPYTKNYRRYVVYFQRVEAAESAETKATETEVAGSEQVGDVANNQNRQSNAQETNIQSTQIRKEAALEDEELLTRDIQGRKVGYGVLGFVGVLVVGKITLDFRQKRRKKEE